MDLMKRLSPSVTYRVLNLLVCVTMVTGQLSVTTETPVTPMNASFTWWPSDWSACVYPGSGQRAPQCCQCHRKRNVTCLYKDRAMVVPSFYCHKLQTSRPKETEPCDTCVVNCAVSVWSEWSQCGATCSPSYRIRTRQVMHPGTPGGEKCGPLVDEDLCPGLPSCSEIDPRPDYQWMSGPWTSCRKSSSQANVCGEGTRYRQVNCASKEGEVVADLFCRHNTQGEIRPIAMEQCPTPCDCEVSRWTDWGPCSVTCHQGPRTDGIQVRTRSIKRRAFNGGKTCPAQRETRACHVHKMVPCPRFVWKTTDWGICSPIDNGAICGAGEQSRDVECVRKDDASQTTVHHVLCMQDAMKWENLTDVLPPTRQRACEVECPKDCQLGQWENWSSCTRSCGPGGIRIRYRPVLIEPDPGGKECKDRFESSNCDNTPCLWWHTAQWSICFPDDEITECGVGHQIRSVYCLSAVDDVLPDGNCTAAGSKPNVERKCRLACGGECRFTEWSDWDSCSASCGPKGGLQSRRREAREGGTISRQECQREMELIQTRPCNQRPCKTHIWQVSAWGKCMRLPNATEPCGDWTGYRNRQVSCELDSGYNVDERFCDGRPKPRSSQLCNAPCPVDCEMTNWSEWSECSATCGKSVRVRLRRVVRWDENGGRRCPKEVDADGVDLHRRRCKRLPPCHSYSWLTGGWSLCLTVQECGHGVRTRNVTCARDDSKNVAQEVCTTEVRGIAPHSQEVCFRPCPGDCVLSEWSDFSTCSQTCGERPGKKTRTRHVVNGDPSLDLSTQCPQLRIEDLTDSQLCGDEACPNYAWVTGPWTSCIVSKSDVAASPFACGEGVQRRHVMCRKGNKYDVANHLCDNIDIMPPKHQSCEIPCPINCQVSEWTVWSNCSMICGMGLQQRERQISLRPKSSGRQCPHLTENRTCTLRDCAEFNWEPLPWGHCQPLFGMPCGRGQQYRDIVCPAGKNLEAECDRRSRRPRTMQECELPCQGDCVMSDWSEWSTCPCGKQDSTQTRKRQLMQNALPSGEQCGATAETKPCNCPPYKLQVGEWTSCHVTQNNATCGPGLQHRRVNCLRTTGLVVSLSLCDLGGLPLSRPCIKECVSDCLLSAPTSWSVCSDSCGMSAYQTRTQEILKEANTLGAICPPPDVLQQNTTCPTVPCYTYLWKRSPWSTCTNSQRGCGLGVQTREITCYRSDGEEVNEATCLNEMKLPSLSISGMSHEEQIENDLNTDNSCGKPCPGDCQISDWSDWGPCFRNCSSNPFKSFQVRTRVIIKSSSGGKACPKDLIKFRSCTKDGAVCPMFFWRGSPWSNSGERKVECLAADTIQVTGGCIDEDRPSSDRSCSPTCPLFSNCRDGRCMCKHGFKEAGKSKLECLPEFGCEADAHCIVNHTFCDVKNKECLCLTGTLPKEGLVCPVVQGAGVSNDKDSGKGLASLFLYILVGSVCALVLISFCLVLLLFKRRKRKRAANAVQYNSVPTGNGVGSGPLKKKEDLVKPKDPDVTLMYNYPSNGSIPNHLNNGHTPKREKALFDSYNPRQDYPNYGGGTLPPRPQPPPEEVPLTSIYATTRRPTTSGGQRTLPLPPSPPMRGGSPFGSRSPSPRVGVGTTSTFKPPPDVPPVGHTNPGFQVSPLSPASVPQSPSSYDNLGRQGNPNNRSMEDLGPPPPVQPRPPATRLPRKPPPSPQLFRTSSPLPSSPDGSSQDMKRHTPEGAITQPSHSTNHSASSERLPPPALVNSQSGPRKPAPPPKPVKRVHYDLPPPDSGNSSPEPPPFPTEDLNIGDGASSTEGTPRHRNPASARLLEYCDELIAELQTMATN